MRILCALDPDLEDLRAVVAGLERLAVDHELIVLQAGTGDALELALRNALPGCEVATVLTDVVVGSTGAERAPRAIPAVRSMRLLLRDGAIVICAAARPLAVDPAGTMRELAGKVDLRPTATLLARRIDADRLLYGCGAGLPVERI